MFCLKYASTDQSKITVHRQRVRGAYTHDTDRQTNTLIDRQTGMHNKDQARRERMADSEGFGDGGGNEDGGEDYNRIDLLDKPQV